ncbi:MAG TPA: hypothetical protein VNI20_03040 [Fimbriimonadaceae bacterium]|nr:hypothetical protein [Fimbriimonadaceae bacterium]
MQRFERITVAVLVTACLAALVFSGWRGLVSIALGMVGTAVFLWGTWIIVRVFSEASQRPGKKRIRTPIMVLALLLKIPLVYAGWIVALKLGPFGPGWFLVGLGLVYCAVVWRAVLAARD